MQERRLCRGQLSLSFSPPLHYKSLGGCSSTREATTVRMPLTSALNDRKLSHSNRMNNQLSLKILKKKKVSKKKICLNQIGNRTEINLLLSHQAAFKPQIERLGIVLRADYAYFASFLCSHHS